MKMLTLRIIAIWKQYNILTTKWESLADSKKGDINYGS